MVLGCLANGHRFPRQTRLVYLGNALHYHAVGRNLVTGTDRNATTNGHLGRRYHPHLVGFGMDPVTIVRPQVGNLCQGPSRPGRRSSFQVLRHAKQKGHRGGFVPFPQQERPDGGRDHHAIGIKFPPSHHGAPSLDGHGRQTQHDRQQTKVFKVSPKTSVGITVHVRQE